MQILSASLAESEPAGHLVSDGLISTNQKFPGLVSEGLPELEELEWNLLSGQNQPKTEAQWQCWAKQLEQNLALARQHLQVHDAIVDGVQAQLLLQCFQIDKLHQSLNHKQNKKQTDQTKLNPGGKVRYLTSDSYVEETERVEAERSQKMLERMNKKIVAGERRLAQAEIKQKWVKIQKDHQRAVQAWEEECAQLTAEVPKRLHPKHPKCVLKPKLPEYLIMRQKRRVAAIEISEDESLSAEGSWISDDDTE